MRRFSHRITALFAIGASTMVLTGCAGGGAGIGTPGASTRTSDRVASASAAPLGNVTFTVKITPKTKASAARLKPKYLSPNTESLTILTDGRNPATLNVAGQNCTPNPSVPDSYTCSISLQVPAGNHVFTVSAYDQTGGQGALLSTNSTGTVVVKPVGTTAIALVLDGVVRIIVLSLATTTPPSGSPAAVGLTAVLQDADGNVIVGAAPFEYPVTLTTTNATAGPLSKTTLKSPADAAGLTVNYTGADVKSITYSATAGPSAVSVTNAVLTPAQTFRTIYTFAGAPRDGYYPGGLIAYDGALYGTTAGGGSGTNCGSGTNGGCGTVFKLTTSGTESIVYNFKGAPDGSNPAGLTVFNDAFYGLTESGGSSPSGTAFVLDPSGAERGHYASPEWDRIDQRRRFVYV